jgi:AcrR family transcriptional regulator
MQVRKRRLSATDWADAALAALAEGGVAAVAVEPLAARLGATKGSFYWHYADRGALVDAALALWEARETDAVIDQLASIDDPAERLRVLFELVLTHPAADSVALLFRDVDDERVGPALERVTRRRLDYVVEQLRLCGMAEAEARARAAVAYAAYVGWWQLRRISPDAAPPGKQALPHAQLLQALVQTD